TPANSFWNDFPALNSYIARVQSFMQQGRSDNDILLYFPVFDRYADPGRGMLEHFDAISPAFRGSPFAKAADTLPKMGYAYDYVSDLQISKSAVEKNLIKTEGNTYSTLLLPGCKYLPLETFEKILKMAEEGAIILLYESLPENVSGFADYLKKNEVFNRLKASLAFKTAAEHVMKAGYGKGKILMGDNIGELLSFAGIRREAMADKGIMFNRRKLPDGTVYFIKNISQNTFQGWLPASELPASSDKLPASSDAGYAAVYNPSTGRSGSTPARKTDNGSAEIFLRINPQETFILKTSASGQKADRYPFYDASAAPEEIQGRWSLEFTEGGPAIPQARNIEKLSSWTETGGDEVRNFSGTASYKTTFRKPAGKADAYKIDLGKVCNSARIILNGEETGILIGPDFSVTVDKKKIKKNNTLEVRVSNLMANRIAWMDRNKIEWKKFYNVNFSARLRENNKNGIFDASGWAPRESGLIGPVTVTRMKEEKTTE
ncbi:MAG TPA: glycosyl hydrolase, partial [Bacteroidales bacterium]|nr:glycosyl hydrolase [Bacteroidales bacterium]